MRIIVIGGKGTIGNAVVKELSPRHELIIAGRTSGDVLCDITSEASIRDMYKKVKDFDAVISCAGEVHFEELSKMSEAFYQVGLKSKLMGQVNLVLLGLPYIRSEGSFTLTAGILSRDPIKAGSSASMVNAAIEGFTRAAAIELPRSIRINAISPTILEESQEAYGAYFRGFNPVPAAKVALAFSKSVEGRQTGQVYEVL